MSNNINNITRAGVIRQCEIDCLREMYRKSQPSGDYDEYVQKVNDGEIKEEIGNEIYRRHYLSREEYQYIVNKYISAYNLEDKWNDHFEILVHYLGNTAKTEITVEQDGFPQRKEYKQLDDISDIFVEVLKNNFAYLINEEISDEDLDKTANELKQAVLNRIEMCRTFYHHGIEKNSFRFNMGLGYGSPTSNKEEVIEYWKRQGIDIEIVDRNPDRFWENDFEQLE